MLADRLDALRDELGAEARKVTFLDMEAVGRNPARIIPAWREFVDASSDHSRLRGVGEPIWAGRREAELVECQLHESLLNVAFDDGPAWRLVCPYDMDSLPDTVVREAMRTHPVVWPESDGRVVGYEGHAHASAFFSEPLPTSPGQVDVIDFRHDDLAGLRSVVERLGARAGIGPDAVDDVTLAAHELATNSLVHGGGHGSMLVWTQPDAFVVEVRDSGRIRDPLVGRELSSATDEHGRGLWMANQLCDLVQVRSTTAGTAVRLHVWR
jgi:anti-sigma regulatory factor (Ser/Thr protein kinase)